MKLNNEDIKWIKKMLQKAMRVNFENIGKEGYIHIIKEGAKLNSLKSCKNKEYNSLCIMYNAYMLNLLANYKNLSKKEKETIIKHSEILNSIVRGIIWKN